MVEAAVQLRPSQNTDALKVVVTGMLRDQRKHEDTFYSVVVMPAPDEYSSPVPFEIRSKRSLGAKDQIVSVPCRLGGFFKPKYTVVDKRTGEERLVRPIVQTLQHDDDGLNF